MRLTGGVALLLAALSIELLNELLIIGIEDVDIGKEDVDE